jgi:hypothetical protein
MECQLIRIPRWLVAIIGVLFAIFHAALGISTLGSYPDVGVAGFVNAK